jgi:cytochrome P450
MLHEPTRYPNPSTFDPARFADRDPSSTTKNPPPDVAYGFGRRVCPGRYLASDTIWIVAASVFAAFEIRRPLDGEGREVLPEVAYTPGLFRCVHFSPYSNQKRKG